MVLDKICNFVRPVIFIVLITQILVLFIIRIIAYIISISNSMREFPFQCIRSGKAPMTIPDNNETNMPWMFPSPTLA